MSSGPSCTSCHRPLLRAVTDPGRERIALDASPVPDGCYEVDYDAIPLPSARRWREEYARPRPDALYTPHADTCRARRPA